MSTVKPYKAVLDVREIPPRERHPLIFGTFERLADSESLLLINDHDPKPLYYQFHAESPGTFTWNYVEQGPEVWQVEIGKVGTGPIPGGAGCKCHH